MDEPILDRFRKIPNVAALLDNLRDFQKR